ncbi:MAG: sigma-70 family RNA polymerase sigma factor [Gammaproteobacteria bacterium]|nr:sigma-70 family RNA polymerase sigma factor [Gammaproteobacteria bacterium]
MKNNHMANSWNNLEEKAWIARAKDGDDIAFGNLVEKYQQPVYNFCYRKLADVTEAEDATQEILIRIYCKLNTYDETRSKFSTWLFSIAGNYCIDRLRLRRQRLVSWDDLSALSRFPGRETSQPEKLLLEAETSQEAYDLLNKLPPDYRTVIILKYWHYRSYQDIAQTLHTTVSAIKSKLFRARQKMAQSAL